MECGFPVLRYTVSVRANTRAFAQGGLLPVCPSNGEWLRIDLLPVDLFVLMQPRNGLARPQAGGISVSKFLGDFAQYRVIVRGLVARHSPPVHRLRCKMRIPIASEYVAVPSFRIGVFLVNKGNATKTIP